MKQVPVPVVLLTVVLVNQVQPDASYVINSGF